MSIDFSNAWTCVNDELKTVSGLKVVDPYIGWFEIYCVDFAQVLEQHGYTSDFAWASLLEEMDRFDSFGEAVNSPTNEDLEMAAFGLILFDRILRAESNGTDYEDLFVMHEELHVCHSNSFKSQLRSATARSNAAQSHSETNKMKEEVFRWLTSENRVFKSADIAAAEIMKQVPVAHITAKRWFKAWKNETSASTVIPRRLQ
jgi:hypothetical protein